MMCAIQGRCWSRWMLSGTATIVPPCRGRLFRSTPPDVLSLGMALDLDSHRGRALAEAMSPLLTDSEVSQQLAGLPNWSRAKGDEPAITATYELTDFVAALDF